MKRTELRQVIPDETDHLLRHINQHHLVFNTCWEDPRIDRQLLKLDCNSRVVMITSAGCNALEYLLDNPAEIHCIDINSRQNALLELKMRMIIRGQYDDFFEMFGLGSHQKHQDIFREVLPSISVPAKKFWQGRVNWFSPRSYRRSFYHYGTFGGLIWVSVGILRVLQESYFREGLKMFDAGSLEEQREIFDHCKRKWMHRILSGFLANSLILLAGGVSRQQIRDINRDFPGGMRLHVMNIFKKIFYDIPLKDNYFWRVYLKGTYTKDCLPEYLKAENFDPIKQRIGRVSINHASVASFLKKHPDNYTHFVLLDHQDWLAHHKSVALDEEWKLILRNSGSGTRILMRSAGLSLNYLPEFVMSRVTFHPELTNPLHPLDRTGTYGNVHLGIIDE